MINWQEKCYEKHQLPLVRVETVYETVIQVLLLKGIHMNVGTLRKKAANAASTVHFVNLLKKHGPDSCEISDYKSAHADDSVFLERVAVLEQLFRHRSKIANHLQADR